MLSLKLEQAARPLYDQQLYVLSKENKLSLKEEIHMHKIKSLPVIFFSMLMAVGALFAICIGVMLSFIDNVIFLSEIFLPFILPGILLSVSIAILLYFAWKEQMLVLKKQQQIAESCYFEALELCKTFKPGEISIKSLIGFIKEEILPSEFSKRFIFTILTQARPSLLAKKTKLSKSLFDESIEEAFSHIREGLYLSGKEKIDHENKLNKTISPES